MKVFTKEKNKSGQLAGYEFAVIAILLMSNAFTLYKLIQKATNQSIYQAGSDPQVISPTTHFGGCSYFRVYERREDTNAKNSPIVNAVNH